MAVQLKQWGCSKSVMCIKTTYNAPENAQY